MPVLTSRFFAAIPSLFAYTDSEADIGNSEDFRGDAKLHLFYFFAQFVRLIKPGRVAIVHCQNIAGLKRNGEYSTIDLRGLLIRLGKRCGFDVRVGLASHQNPQSQAIRTCSTKLQFATLNRDQANLCPAFSDYLIKFRAAGDNEVPVTAQLSRK